MAKIYYGMSGDGRGHATRVQTVVEMLRDRHAIVLYAPLDAYDLLAPRYRGSKEVLVRRIPGIRSRYDESGTLHYLPTILNGVPRHFELRGVVDRLQFEMEREKPDLVLTDFDPLLPRAARRTDVPLVSIDHQHLLVHENLTDLPMAVRTFAAAGSLYVRSISRGAVATFISSFQHLPLKEDATGVHTVGALIREEIREAETRTGEHLVAYFRREAPPNVLDSLAGSGAEVRIYGLDGEGRRGNLWFRPVDHDRFVEDLAASRGVVCTAGNQLVGEALYLEKPVLAVPEPGNREQELNAHLLQRNGGGEAVAAEDFRPATVRRFLDRVEEHRSRIDPDAVIGNPELERLLEAYLPAGSTAGPEPARTRQRGRVG